MKLIKSLLLGSAAGLLAVAGAQAADLPSKKAAPAEYVKVCTAYGAGFFYIPGTDTCIKFDGLVLGAWQGINPKNVWTPTAKSDTSTANLTTGAVTTTKGAAAYTNTGVNYALTTAGKAVSSGGFFSRGRLNVDTRSETAYGTLRGYFRLQIQNSSLGAAGTNATSPVLDKGYLQWAGLTAGRAQSFYDFYADDFTWNDIGGSNNTVNTFAYTATFGGGFQATVALEDSRIRQSTTAVGGTGTLAGGTTGVALGGTRVPNVVAALRVDQGWGSAQLSGAYQSTPLIASVPTTASYPKAQNGWGVQAGVKILLPMLAAGDALYLQAAYSQAALSYVGLGGSNVTANFNGTGFIDNVYDVVSNGTSLDKAKAWNVLGAFKHYFMPNLSVALLASYSRANYGALTNVFLPDVGLLVVGSKINYSPVKNLDLSLEGLYARTNASTPTGIVSVPAPGVFKKNQSDFVYRIMAQRSF